MSTPVDSPQPPAPMSTCTAPLSNTFSQFHLHPITHQAIDYSYTRTLSPTAPLCLLLPSLCYCDFFPVFDFLLVPCLFSSVGALYELSLFLTLPRFDVFVPLPAKFNTVKTMKRNGICACPWLCMTLAHKNR